VLIPIDHGLSDGPVLGLEHPWTVLQPAVLAGIQGVVTHKGLLRRGVERTDSQLSRILHLSGSTTLSPWAARKVLVGSVTEAVRLGADGVSVHVNLGVAGDHAMLRDLGRVATACDRWGLPLLAMMYVRRVDASEHELAAMLKHAARAAAELGADLVKVTFPGHADTFFEITSSCFVPVLVAGGAKAQRDADVLTMVRASLHAGGSGACIGRNVFQHPVPRAFLRALSAVVHDDADVEDALGLAGSTNGLAARTAAVHEPSSWYAVRAQLGLTCLS
jgi:predicted phospho-2-dehydro-3-deoxyheptonate aldolase